jgi:uncharacterized protein YbjT (DUF2867 family)
MILVTGAAGKSGRAVIEALTQRNASVRAFVHRPAQVAAVQAAGAAETVVGDFHAAAVVAQAVAGVQAIYHICPNMHPDEVAIGRQLIEAARHAKVAHFVYHSVLHPQTAAMPHHWHKLQVEEWLFTAHIPFTILQPTAYMQNILAGWAQICAEGLFTVPYPPATRLALVDLADVAAAAATVLTEPGHQGATYELVGTTALTQDEVAAQLSETLGRPVQANAISHAAWERGARAGGLPAYAIDTLLTMFRYYEAYGLIGNPNTLGWLLGRPPTSLAAFLERVRQ